MSEKTKNQSIGALWKRKQKSDGKTYLSGQIELKGEVVKFVAFTNSFKEEDKHPDFKIYIANENGATKPAAKPVAKAAAKPVARPITAPEPPVDTEPAATDDPDLF
jgi:hypothetical protein